jgi:hypothetical protein
LNFEARKFGQTPKNTPKFTKKLQLTPFRKRFLNLLKSRKFNEPFFQKLAFLFGMAGGPEERGFNVSGLRAKCKPACPFENKDCCMARLLSHQEDFANQVSMLEGTFVSLCPSSTVNSIQLKWYVIRLTLINYLYLQYWEWAKYHYRQIEKNTFDQAKTAAFDCLDACPTDVIRKFVNRSWCFMDAYRKGLTRDAAAWAVKQQKGHRKVSQQAMMQIASIVN